MNNANEQLEYVSEEEFEKKLAVFAETNLALKAMKHPNASVKRWQDLPSWLIQDLFNKLGCKPDIRKY